MSSAKRMDPPPAAGRPPDRERIIADALVDVAAELRLTDVAELIDLIRNDEAANLADLVNSSTELFFKRGALRYALSATYSVPWTATPVVSLDMEFRHETVSAFFRLTIGEKRARVEIADILYDERGLDEPAKAERLTEAFAGARVRAQEPGRGGGVSAGSEDATPRGPR